MTASLESAAKEIEHRSGFCVLAGLANVGKSTLLNRLVGRKLAIVTPRAQTTRRRLAGIYGDEAGQVVFEDTPGLVEPRYLLQAGMRQEAEAAIRDADVVVYVADCGFAPSIEGAASFRPPAGTPAVLCLNKRDRVSGEELEALRERFAGRERWRALVPTVATEPRGVDELREAVLAALPPGPPLYPPDQISTATLRELAAEFVRECCFTALEEEVPYSVAVVVDAFREGEDPVYVSAVIHVERDSQKGIVIGESGRTIRRIGTCAREEIERLLDARVYLDLWVKVWPKWRKKATALGRLGLPAPEHSHRE